MDARKIASKSAILFATIFISCLFSSNVTAQRFTAKSTNFVVHAPNSGLAEAIAQKAEVFRKDLALQWLGYEIPNWNQPCPIYVQLAMQAGGETSFAFIINPQTGTGTPVDWEMKIFGPPDRLLDAVLPHEITHTIFASHFGRPLPRWADEGACTTVEHESERAKNHQMLLDFLTARPSRGIPFNRMFVMRDYPRDILPLYAQGYSLSRFLVMQKGHRHFVDYIGTGMAREGGRPNVGAWNVTTKEFYGFEDLSDLYLAWIKWVEQGSPDLDPSTDGPAMNVPAIAASQQQSRQQQSRQQQSRQQQPGQTETVPAQTFTSVPPTDPAPRQIAAAFRDPMPISNTQVSRSNTPAKIRLPEPESPPTSDAYVLKQEPLLSAGSGTGGWYQAQRRTPDDGRIAARREDLNLTDLRANEYGTNNFVDPQRPATTNSLVRPGSPGKIDMSTLRSESTGTETIWR